MSELANWAYFLSDVRKRLEKSFRVCSGSGSYSLKQSQRPQRIIRHSIGPSLRAGSLVKFCENNWASRFLLTCDQAILPKKKKIAWSQVRFLPPNHARTLGRAELERMGGILITWLCTFRKTSCSTDCAETSEGCRRLILLFSSSIVCENVERTSHWDRSWYHVLLCWSFSTWKSGNHRERSRKPNNTELCGLHGNRTIDRGSCEKSSRYESN